MSPGRDSARRLEHVCVHVDRVKVVEFLDDAELGWRPEPEVVCQILEMTLL